MFDRRPDIWLPAYALGALNRAIGRRRRRRQLTHIIFLVCDHFEPRHAVTSEKQAFDRVEAWHTGYVRLQNRCREAWGTTPVHSFFFPPHHGIEHLARLSEMVYDGLGEVELHYHHHGDTEDSFRKEFGATIDEYRRWGFLLESGEDPRPSFGFIHGDWALNNSCHDKFCGVNDEITVLQEFGCWGDLTMPSGNVCQTRKINSIYYATSNPDRPKNHDTGKNARTGVTDARGMLMIQGPLGVNWQAPDHPRIENSNLTTRNWGRPDRVRKWLDCNIHVDGRPEWQFVKLHTHGALERDFDGLFGDSAFAMHRELNEKYNDGEQYRLHYVTARQAYNIIKAAEDGKSGDPSQWLDYVVKPQPHSFYSLDVRHTLKSCTGQRLDITDMDSTQSAMLRTRIGPVQELRGTIESLSIDSITGSVQLCNRQTGATIALKLAAGQELFEVVGATTSERLNEKGWITLTLTAEQCLIRSNINMNDKLKLRAVS